MSGRGDDVSSLFKSFGADRSQYKELTRTTGALEAQARWPLFGKILTEENAARPSLSVADKERWLHQKAGESAASTASGLSLHAEGDLMAHSLRELARRVPDARQHDNRNAPIKEQNSRQSISSHPVYPPPIKSTPLPVGPRSSIFERLSHQEHAVQKGSRVSGLLPKDEPISFLQNRPRFENSASDGVLVNIFKRLEQENERPVDGLKSSFLRCLDR